ncbi:MAG: hypothetical protein NZ571_12015 [Anaerolineae bacterium]|nr:hypothetical protein [Anaerolineae bacterium]
MLKQLTALCLLAGTLLCGLHALYAQDATPIAYGAPFDGEFTTNTQARFTFNGKAGDVIYIFPQGTDLFSTLEFDIQLADSRNTSLGTVYNKERQKPVLVAELPADDRYVITLTANKSGRYRLNLEKTLNLLPSTQVEGVITPEETRFFLIRSSQPLKIALTYARLSGTYSPELRIEDFVSGYPREVAAIFGRALDTGTLQLTLEANVEYLVTLGQKPFDIAGILEAVTPQRYRISVKSAQ